MTDKQLAGFLAIAEKGSFTAAADSLYISQSALSQQIAQLEQQLGFALFDRRARRATMTESGAAFCEKARQILSLYRSGVEEGKYLAKLAEEQRKRLLVGCIGDQFLQIWMDLFLITREVSIRYAPRPVRYESPERLYAALRQGDADVAIQLESPEIRRQGLRCIPIARTIELCLFPPGMTESPVEEGQSVTMEELEPYAIAFHNDPGACDYEDTLRDQLAKHLPEARLLNPIDFFSASFVPTVLLVPAIQHLPHKREYVRPLAGADGARVCFVLSPKCDDWALDYVQYIKEHITQELCPWYLPLEET